MNGNKIYTLEISSKAEKALDKLEKTLKDKINEHIFALALNPRPQGVKKLQGRENEYRIRIENYRVIYKIFEKRIVVKIIQIGHRREIYD